MRPQTCSPITKVEGGLLPNTQWNEIISVHSCNHISQSCIFTKYQFACIRDHIHKFRTYEFWFSFQKICCLFPFSKSYRCAFFENQTITLMIFVYFDCQSNTFKLTRSKQMPNLVTKIKDSQIRNWLQEFHEQDIDCGNIVA